VFIENKLTRRSLLSALSLLPAARLLRAQDLPTLKRAPQPSADGEEKPKYQAEAKLVNVFATVKDKSSGKLITGLTKDDFTIEDEGKPQTIKFFEAETSLPLHLGMLVDTSYHQGRVLQDERSAGIKFFDQVLHEKDQAFVIHFDKDIELLQDFTDSRDKLDRALNLLEPAQPPQQSQQQGGGGNPQGGGYPGGGGRRYPQQGGAGGYRSRGVTKLYDAILLASEDLMGKQQGRKAIVLMTDGIDSGSKTTLFEAISAAQKADTAVYSVLFADETGSFGNPGYGGMGRRGSRMPMPTGRSEGPDGKKILQQIAEQTGGTFNSVGTFHHLDKIFADLQDDLRSQYSLGFIPDAPGEIGLYRHIQVTAKLKKKDLVVQARAGYYVQ
jgi:VWFA-related protein